MIDYYFATIFFAVALMVVMKIMLSHNDLLEKNIKKKMDIVATIVILTSISEWGGVQLDGAPVAWRGLHILVKVTELSLAPVIPVLCAEIIGDIRGRKVIRILLVCQAAMEIMSAFGGFIFSVDENNFYHHEAYYWIYIVSFTLGILLFAGMALGQSMKQYGMRRMLLLMLPVFAACGLFFQYCGGEEIRIIWLCSAMDIMLMYILYQELTMNTDALTHLLSRRYYESKISRLNHSAIIYYFDVNNFKKINDTFGHSFGDVCLSTVGSCIQDAFGSKGTCYRIGGDEFCAILQIKPENAEEYLKAFTMQMRIRREHMKELPYVSVGYAYYEPGRSSITDIIKEADTMMYHFKRLSKEVGEQELCIGLRKEEYRHKK